MQVGVFAVNFAPAVCGPLLDWAGPRFSAVAGSAIATLGTVLLAVSHPGGPDAFAGGAFCLGQRAETEPPRTGLLSSVRLQAPPEAAATCKVKSFVCSGCVCSCLCLSLHPDWRHQNWRLARHQTAPRALQGWAGLHTTWHNSTPPRCSRATAA